MSNVLANIEEFKADLSNLLSKGEDFLADYYAYVEKYKDEMSKNNVFDALEKLVETDGDIKDLHIRIAAMSDQLCSLVL